MTPTRRAIAAIGAGVLLVAACGDDDDALFDDEADETDETDADADDDATDTVDDDDSDDDAAASVEVAGDFCGVVSELDSLDEIEDTFTDPAAVETQISEVVDLYAQGSELAPDEIADDFDLAGDSVTTLADAFAAADYNMLDVEVSLITDLDDPTLEDATDRLEEYGERECGIDTSDNDDDDEDDDNSFEEIVDELPEGATIRDGIIQQLASQGIDEDGARCIGEALEPADLEDDTAIAGHIQSCGLDPTTGQPLDD